MSFEEYIEKLSTCIIRFYASTKMLVELMSYTRRTKMS